MSIESTRDCVLRSSAAKIESFAMGGSIATDEMNRSLALTDAYRSGDASKIAMMASSENDIQCMIGLRNGHWIEAIEADHMSGSKAFFAVGIFHLYSAQDDLLKLLAKRGFKILRQD